MLSSGADGTERLWDIEHRRLVRTSPCGKTTGVAAPERAAVAFLGSRSVALTPDGKRALVAGPELELWDMEKRERIRRYENCPEVRGVVAVTPDGKRGVAFHADGKLRLWSLDAPWALASVDASGMGEPTAIAFDPRGEWVLVGTIDGRFYRFSLPR